MSAAVTDIPCPAPVATTDPSPSTLTQLAYALAVATDRRWSEELQKTFGEQAGDMRYRKEGEGEPGSRLRRAFEEWRAANDLWRELMVKGW